MAECAEPRDQAHGQAPIDEAKGPILAPWRMSAKDWKAVLLRVWSELDEDHVSVVAAGMAFFTLLAVLPLFTVLVSVYGLVADPSMVHETVSVLGALIPSTAWAPIEERLQELVEQPKSVLGLSFLLGLGGSLWAVSNAAASLVEGVGIVYDKRDTRSFLAVRWLSLKLTAALVGLGVVGFGLGALLPLAMNLMGLPGDEQAVMRFVRWPLMLATALVSLAYIYRVAPDRRAPRWRWVSLGSLLATVVWLIGSALFSVYVDLAGNYDRTYGSAGGVIVFMLWLYVSAFAVLLGAEVNAEIERQTAVDPGARRDGATGERGAR